jgi:acyl carrier protein
MSKMPQTRIKPKSGLECLTNIGIIQGIAIYTHGGIFMATVEERIKSIIVELLGVDEDKVVPAARFREDLEADSLDLVELIMGFEEEFGGEISDEEAQKITTVGEAIEYVNTRMVD